MSKRIAMLLVCMSFLFVSCSNTVSKSSEESGKKTTTVAESSSVTESEESESMEDTDQRLDISDAVNNRIKDTLDTLPQDTTIEINEQTVGENISSMYEFANNTGCFPVYKCDDLEYYHSGEDAFEAIEAELKKAQRYIFLEFFIIEEGEMWNRVYDILKAKAAEGVEVCVLYDGLMDGTQLPVDFPQTLAKDGIKCHAFSPLVSGSKNNVNNNINIRDHRKIVVVDGKVAFTGGINIADEYINLIQPYGRWKDNSIRISGRSVDSFVLMFLQLWIVYENDTDIKSYTATEHEDTDNNGYIMPFSDNPFDEYAVAKSFYMSILEKSKDYVYIITPYLIPDDEFEQLLISTAKRGVDVRIIAPGVSDGVSVDLLTKSHYRTLIESGIKIYEFSPGFIHAKIILSDDKNGIAGTINIDSRSFLYDFECGLYMYDCNVLKDIRKEFDFESDDYKEITTDDIDSYSEIGGNVLQTIEGFF